MGVGVESSFGDSGNKSVFPVIVSHSFTQSAMDVLRYVVKNCLTYYYFSMTDAYPTRCAVVSPKNIQLCNIMA